MNTLKFTASLYNVGAVTKLPKTNRVMQRLRFQVNPTPDKLGRILESVNYYDVFIYGQDEIDKAWKDHKPEYPTPTATVTVQVVGRMRLDEKTYLYWNNITFRLINIIWNYD